MSGMGGGASHDLPLSVLGTNAVRVQRTASLATGLVQVQRLVGWSKDDVVFAFRR